MDQVLVESLSKSLNAWVIRTPGREFPALVVQGDAYSQLLGLAQSILDRARAERAINKELIDEAEELRDMLRGRLEHYELTLRDHGLPLPYAGRDQHE
jgi:hypothetical protein